MEELKKYRELVIENDDLDAALINLRNQRTNNEKTCCQLKIEIEKVNFKYRLK